MKKFIIILLLALTGHSSLQAQEIYEEVIKMAREKIDDPQVNATVKDFSRFKLNALNYLGMKLRETSPDAPVTVLDNEAYALHGFINLYTKMLLDNATQPPTFQKKIIKVFMDASYESPLFHDSDSETVLFYYKREDCLTRFSLDTNWIEALEKVTNKLKELQ